MALLCLLLRCRNACNGLGSDGDTLLWRVKKVNMWYNVWRTDSSFQIERRALRFVG